MPKLDSSRPSALGCVCACASIPISCNFFNIVATSNPQVSLICIKPPPPFPPSSSTRDRDSGRNGGWRGRAFLSPLVDDAFA